MAETFLPIIAEVKKLAKEEKFPREDLTLSPFRESIPPGRVSPNPIGGYLKGD